MSTHTNQLGPTPVRRGLCVRLVIPKLVLLISMVTWGLSSSAGAQLSPGQAIQSTPTVSASRGDDPIGVVAHGAIFDATMKQIDPSPDFIRTTLDRYILRLTKEATSDVRATLEKHRTVLRETFGTDEMTPRFLLLDSLITAVAPKDRPYLEVRNHALRRAWYKGLLGSKRWLTEVDRRTNLPHVVSKFGRENGMMTMATEAAGEAYIKECRKAQVPIPPQWGGGGWTYVGDLTTNFLGVGTPTQVWRADSTTPKGLCVALPRFADPTTINALGVICLGTESSNACFYDASDVPVGSKWNAEDFLSGADLWNGVCTDCHAGENPYIVHPGSPLDIWPANKPQAWHKPLIKPSWPQNPGPFGLLTAVPINPLPPDKDGSCLTCHTPEGNGRFPDILALNAWKGGESGYCSVVLKKALGNTMPGTGSAHDKHAQAMLAFCGQSSPPGGEVPRPNTDGDPKVISPPLVIGPLYACAEAVEVGGGIYGAKLTVSIKATSNAISSASALVTSPSKTIVSVPALKAGDVVTAVQDVSGVVSDPSTAVKVIDHTVAYPTGLPKPVIDPKVIYQCGNTIAVRHVRGAKVTVFTNGADEVTYTTGGDWTNLPPKIRPFILKDEYTAEQSFCTDKSLLSVAETAGALTTPMPIPAITPAPIAGQPVVNVSSLANGALTTVAESSAGDVAVFTTAVGWQQEVDVATKLGGPIQAGQKLSVVSKLCDGAKVSIPEALPCQELAAPKIATPLVGHTFVTVTDAVPGARILVFDAALKEIGDGSGVQVGLTRPIVFGDILTVIQTLGTCSSAKAYQTGVVCASNKGCG